MGIPLCVICRFPLAAFNIWSLCLIFINLINTCLGVFLSGFILFGTLWVSWTWVAISFPILGKFSTIISWPFFSIYFLMTFLFVFSWDSYDLNVGTFHIVPEVSEGVLISFFVLFSSLLHLLPPFYLPPHLSSASAILLFVPYRVFFI